MDTSGTEFRVAGIVDTGGSEDSIIYALAGDVDKLTGSTRGVDVIEYSAGASDLAGLVSSINDMTSMHVKAQQVTKITASDTRVITMLQTLFWIVSLVVLVLTLVGVGTTISSIVSQRRNEIGLRKALGASSRAIGTEFYIESSLYGLIGGLIGTAIGYGLAGWLCMAVFERSIGFNWWLALISVLFSALISAFGIRKMMRFFPPVVTGPIIIAIGLILAPSAISNCQSNWLLAFVALATVIVCNIWGKGMVKILPILIGVLVSYAVALVTGAVDFERIASAAWFGIPLHKEAMGLFAIDGSPEFISALFTIIPIALATMMEHIGDIAAISATVGHNYINDPGLNRTLMGDGLATTLAGLLGGPANTTYGENTGVLALSKIYDPLVIRIAAVLAIILSFSPKFEAVINTIPTGIIGGISFVLYGMISAIGVRNVVENRVDFTNSRNLIIAAVILVSALGFNSVGGLTFAVAGVSINLSGLAIAAIVGILLNAILPGNDYEFDSADGADAPSSGNLQV